MIFAASDDIAIDRGQVMGIEEMQHREIVLPKKRS